MHRPATLAEQGEPAGRTSGPGVFALDMRVGAVDSQDIRFYLSIFLRRLHYFLVPLLVAAFAGYFIATGLPPTYRAAARILVETPRIPADGASAVSADPIRQLQVLEQQLTTRSRLLAMADKFAIYPADVLSTDAVVSDMLERTKVQPVEYSDLGGSGTVAFEVSFEAGDPVLAADVANAYATAILDANVRERRARATEARAFFRREVDRLQIALDEAQDAILRFKREHNDALPDGLEFRRMQQGTFEERLRQLQREEVSLQQRRSTIEHILAVPANGSASAEEQRLADLRRVLAEQQSIFSDDSPNLRALRARITELESRLSGTRPDPLDISQRRDISPELRVQFADTEAQLDFTTKEKESVGRSLSELARSITETEMNATKLSALERNYETVERQHNEAVARLAEASTAQRIETDAIGGKLTLIEHATPPAKPVWPRRRAIALGSLAAGFGLGLGLVVLMEFWTPSIRRPADLASVFDGQPFATIPYISNGEDTLSRALAATVIILALLGSVPGFLFARKHLPVSIGAISASFSAVTGMIAPKQEALP
jgi:succinoglycan biosynthesis transport protein ExoP